MKKAQIAHHRIEYYDGDITEMPAVRFHAFQKFLLVDAGIGGTLEDTGRHMDRIRIYVAEGEKDKALTEIANMKQNLHFVIQGINPRHLAFCAMIHRIDGELHTDTSDEGNKRLNEKIKHQLTMSWYERLVGQIKKKLNLN